jgi:sialidase-1
VKRKDFTWYATGPGHGIQLRSGRLLLPCDHTQAVKYEHTDPVRSHVIYSDDGGRSWQLGGIISAPNSSECGLVELAPDRVLLEFRHDTERHTRGFAISQDGGLSFGAPHFVVQPDPGCGGGVTDVNGEVWISHLSHASQRENLVIRASRDLQHFPELHSVWRGPAAYSELIATRDVVLCLFEAGEQHPYETIRVARLPLNGN